MSVRYHPERRFPDRPYLPGRTSRPAGAPDQPDWDGRAGSLVECADYRWGIDLYNHGYYWEAHEAWEQLWRRAEPSAVRELLQGLIQCAGAALKAAIEQPSASRRLIDKALGHLARAGDVCAGIDVQQLAEQMAASDGQSDTLPRLQLRHP